MDEQKKKFLDDNFFGLTIRATFQHSKTYRNGAKEQKKNEFKRTLRELLTKLARKYSNRTTCMDDDSHIKNIEYLADNLSKKYAEILAGGRFRIGSAQKALNLYLKYLWCAGYISMPPPHCPFDRKIIAELPGCNGINWTELDCIENYKCLVEAANDKSQGVCLAEWELKEYNDETS